jgi:peptide/nickel transport system substrate-binding protein
LREAFAAHGGEEIDTQGDSFFVAFRSAPDAVAAAVAIQRSLADHEWPDGVEVRVRIGIHSGEASAAGERYVGFSVHRAARVGAAAHGGQVLLSDATRVLVEDDLPQGVYLRDLGTFRLKDIDRPERITQATAEGLKVDFPPLRGAEPVRSRPLLRWRSALAAALIGVVAAAVAIPVFALSSGGSGGSASSISVDENSIGTLDASSGRLIGSSRVATAPEQLATGEGSIWATNPGTNTVSRVDAKTNARIGTVEVGNDPTGIAVGGGFVWVTNGLEGTVSKIDPSANGGNGAVVDTLTVGNGPSGVAFGGGRLWVANSLDRTVSSFVPGTRNPAEVIRVGAGADAIAYGDGVVWVVGGAGNSVTRISARTGTLLPSISVGNGPSGIAVGAGAVWVVNSFDGSVSRIDPSLGAAGLPIQVGGNPTTVAAGNGAVWASDGSSGTLSQIDATATKLVHVVHTSNPPAGLAVSGGRLYVAVGTPVAAHRGGTLVVYPDAPFDTVDPAAAYLQSSWSALISTNDGLVTFQRVRGVDGIRLVPDLATSLPTIADGGKTYTFQIRPGIHYSTGALVQPADFRRAIERSLENQSLKAPVGTGFYLTGIVGAAACINARKRCDLHRGILTDPTARSVTFRLTAPDPDFLDKLALPAADAVPADTPSKARLPLPATGPYRIKSYDPDHGATLVRNPRFHEWSAAAQPNGFPDRIVYEFDKTTSARAQLNAVEQGKADYATTTVGTITPLRRGGYGSQIHVNPTFSTFYFWLNTRLAPFDRVGVRRALNFAVDRNRLARLGEAGFAIPLQQNCQVLPPNSSGYSRFCYPFDPARAKRLIAASGTAGQIVTVVTGPLGVGPSRYFVSLLDSLGYKARLKTFASRDDYDAVIATGKFQIGPQGWFADFPGPSQFFTPLLICGAPRRDNLAGFCSRRVDRDIKQASALELTDPSESVAHWSRIDHNVMQQAPWVPYANGGQIDFVSRRVGNYQYNLQWGPLFDQMWVR